MARYTFNLPDIGEGIAEAEIVAWHVKPGDRVEEDGKIADLMTDKATVEMESPVAGVVLEVAGEVGDVIAIGSPLVVLETDEAGVSTSLDPNGGEGAISLASPPTAQPPFGSSEVETPQTAPSANPAHPEPVEGSPSPSAVAQVAEEKDSPSTSSGQAGLGAREVSPTAEAPGGDAKAKVLASPAVRQRARDLGIDLAQVRPGAEGRVRHADLDAFLSYNAGQGYGAAGKAQPDEVIKVVGLRRRIAENMAAAKRHIPHFTYVEECDVTELEALRVTLNAQLADRPKLTLLPLLIAGVCRVLPQFPMLNARYDDEANVITRHGAVHLGMATMTPAGLMVPVIRDAQGKNLWQLAAEIVRLAEAARSGKAAAGELSGSTFTLSSLGPLGGIASTPVINRPEVAILAPNRIVERPMFVADGMGGERIAKRKLMNLSISCDHRVVDGYDAAAFVQEVKRLLENPAVLLA